MQRVWILNGKNKTYDHDVAMLFFAMLTEWIISWFWISWTGATAEIEIGKAFIKATRNNWQIVWCSFENTANVVTDLTWTKKVYIEITQAKVDDWTNNNEDWSGIAEIKTGADRPASNYLKLYSVASWVITDERVQAYVPWDTLDLSSLTQDIVTTWKMTIWSWPDNPEDVPSKEYVDDIILWNVIWNLRNNNYLFGETVALWKSLFIEEQSTFADATVEQNIGYSYWDKRISTLMCGSWIASDNIKLSLKEVWSPSLSLGVRVETDNAGMHSWTLVDPNAVWTISSLTGSFADATITFAGSFSVTKWQKVHLVLHNWTYWSETFNETNYYVLWYSPKNTTTRKSLLFPSEYSDFYKNDDFPWSSLDASYWNGVNIHDVTWWNLRIQTAGGYAESVDAYDGNYTVQCNLWLTQWFSGFRYANLRLEIDANNYVQLSYYSDNWDVTATIYQGWSSVYSVTIPTLNTGTTFGSEDVKIERQKDTNLIRFFRWDQHSTNARVQIWTDQTFTLTGAFNVKLLQSWSAWLVYFSDYYLTIASYSSQFPFDTTERLPYYTTDLFKYRMLSLSDAKYSYKLPNFPMLAYDAWDFGEVWQFVFDWISKNVSWIYNETMYISDTAGEIQNTPWTNSFDVWTMIDEDSILLKHA